MMEVEDMLKDYVAPDGVVISGEMLGPPAAGYSSGFEWAGEWTVTYETFRDMGIAFGIALVLIYMLVVWEFGNFVLPAIIMAPIPLTLVGIVPGHWLMNAEFTATSMIGFIALAGIIVRNSILLVDYAQHRVIEGVPVLDALIESCQVRTRPIVITALALVGGASVILFDPIFQGMAVALLFGVLVSTALTLFIIPLGCYSARHHLMPSSGDDGPESDVGNDSGGKSGGAGAAIATGFGMITLYAWELIKSIAVGVLDVFKSLGKWNSKRMDAAAKKKAEDATVTAVKTKEAATARTVPSASLVSAEEEPSIEKSALEAESKSIKKPQAKKAVANNKKKSNSKKAAAEKTAIEKAAVDKVAAEKVAAGLKGKGVKESDIADKVAALKAAAASEQSSEKKTPTKTAKKVTPQKVAPKKNTAKKKPETVPVKKKLAAKKPKGGRGIRLKGKP
jgi:hypothetical protein